MWYTKINCKLLFWEDFFMKTFWRALWLAAVACGGVALVRVGLEILNRENNKKYINV